MNPNFVRAAHVASSRRVVVILSVFVAVLGSWTALDLYSRVDVHRGRTRLAWLTATAVAMGLSIWAMHFVAMLGYHTDFPVRYEAGLTIASLVLAVISTAGAFFAIQSRLPSRTRVIAAGLAMGTGICLMHYVGMAAIRAPASLHYRPALVAASFVIAVAASLAALWAALRERSLRFQAVGAVVLGFAICSMHYTGMAAVRFTPTDTPTPHVTGLDNMALAFGVASATLLLLFLAILASMFDRRLETLAGREAVAIAEREQHLRTILSQLPVGVVVADAATNRLDYANPEAERLMGAKLTGMRWPGTDAFTAVHEDGHSFLPAEYPLSRALTGEHVHRQIVRYRLANGTEFIGEVSAAPIRDGDDQVGQAILAVSDVTARIEAEEGLRQGVKLQALGQLTGGIAHDFNNLLTVIQGSADLLCRGELTKEKRDRHIRAIAETAQRAAELTGQLLSFAPKQPLKAEIFDLNDRVSGIAELLGRTAGSRYTVVLDLASEPCVVEADPAQLEAAVLNVGVNARDAMPNGGTITLSTRVIKNAAPHAQETGDSICLSIRDTGTGIAPEIRARVLEPFFTTKGPGRGTGLGLSQAYGFVQQSGGNLEIESQVGKGTTVTFRLPRAAMDPAPVIKEERGRPPMRPIDLLLVEDNEEVGRFATELLSDYGVRVRRASSGEEALEVLLSGMRVDLVFSDIVMPGMTGIDLVNELRSRGIDIPVVLTSGYSEDVLRGQAAGLIVVPKPYRVETLATAFEKVLAAPASV